MKALNRTPANQKGIMLIEALLLTLLVSILAIIIIPRFLSISDNARYEACRTNVANIDTLVQQFYIREATWPAGDLSDIGTNINYFPSAELPECPVTGGASYTIISPTHRVTGHLRGDPTHP
jgi:type II secretory pathway pseudopilin PulG